MNRLSKLLFPANVRVDVPAGNKAEALAAASALFTGCGCSPEQILGAVTARERLGSTAMGRGVAIPHGRVSGLPGAMVGVVRLADPVAFDAPDGQPVQLLLVLLVPDNAAQLHLDILSEVAQMLSEPQTRERLMREPSAAAVRALIAGWEPMRPAA